MGLMPWTWFKKEAEAEVAVENLPPGPDVLAEAKKLAQPVSTNTSNYSAVAAGLKETREKLLKCEEAAKTEIDAKIRDCELRALDQKYRRMDGSFLLWRNKESGWPVFAFFTPSDPICEFSAERSWHIHDSVLRRPEYVGQRQKGDDDIVACFMKPNIMGQKYFSDVYTKLCKDVGRYQTLNLSAQFSGMLPDKIRNTINDLKHDKSFDKILIIAEAPKWELKKIAKPVNLDPLLVGMKYDELFLIDTFDLTPTENIIASEFAVSLEKKPLPFDDR